MFSRTVPRSLPIKGFMGQAIIIFIFHMMCKMTGLAVTGARPLGNPGFSHDTYRYIGIKFLKLFCAVRFLKVSCFYVLVIILIFPKVCNMTSLAVIGARPLTPPSPQGCPPPAILDKRSLRRFFRSGPRCQQNVATYPGGQRRNKDRADKKTQRKIKRHKEK